MSHFHHAVRVLSADRKSRSSLFCAAAMLFAATAAHGQTTSPNTGSLGATADGTNAAAVTSGPGVVAAGGDLAAVYDGSGANTTIPFRSQLNPPAASPFTIEFWARPTASDNDDAVVSNRLSSGDRAGWIFFQRDAATGWNFRMYNGAGSGLGFDLTGGTATQNEWSHVVATWNGSASILYVNGQLADNSNDPAATGVYNAGATTVFSAGAIDNTNSPFTGSVDEVAFYSTALSPAQVLAHFSAVSSATPGAYYSLIQADGALLQLSNVPEPSTLTLLAATATLLLRRRASRRLA